MVCSTIAARLCAGLLQVCLYKALRPHPSPSLRVETASSIQPKADRISMGRHQVRSKFHPARLAIFRGSSTTLPFPQYGQESKTRQTTWHLCYPSESQHLAQNCTTYRCPNERIARSHIQAARQPVAVVEGGVAQVLMHPLTDVGHIGHLLPFLPSLSIWPAGQRYC
ncbi:hypothetical protein B0H65DRAFT_55114 [Neurospora tetraspora]|uniref:Uncharacterized protein n=1 Tax=Neurospora tetraspora TaxID=94610 RepID=A0AAE0JQ49_9PEZI|nr:hypothetical protein B0H65DRAFT_55114 [Neurospora tetraspora]